RRGGLLLAHGRDPYFPGWPDTSQLDYSTEATQEAMLGELLKIAGQSDGVRCDMAMLVLPDVFERTWGRRAPLFWPDATRRVRERVPGFTFMAEVYWDLVSHGWLREQGPKRLHIDPARMVVTGGSAGGYLTLMAGFRVKPKPAALVAYWGYGDVDGDWYTKPSEHY